jgi:uncharacterized protein (DUF2345 family)
MRLFAARGKIEIQAQSDAIEITSDQDMQIMSVKSKVHISAHKEIIMTAGGSFIKINENGIELGTDGKCEIYASSHEMLGPKTHDSLKTDFNESKIPLKARTVLHDELGRILDIERYAEDGTDKINSEASEHELKLFADTKLAGETTTIQVADKKYIITTASSITLSKKNAITEDE